MNSFETLFIYGEAMVYAFEYGLVGTAFLIYAYHLGDRLDKIERRRIEDKRR